MFSFGLILLELPQLIGRIAAAYFYMLDALSLLPSPPLSEHWRSASRCHTVCVSAALVSAAKVIRCIQCSLVLCCISFCCQQTASKHWWVISVILLLLTYLLTYLVLLTRRRRCCGQRSNARQREDSRVLAKFQLQSLDLGAEMRSDTSMKAWLGLYRCQLQDDGNLTRSVDPLSLSSSFITPHGQHTATVIYKHTVKS